jgi:hypothetical protein
MYSLAAASKPQHPVEWDIWLRLARPRLVRMQKRQRFLITLILTAEIAIATVLLGALFAEWPTHPATRMMETDIWRAVPFMAGDCFCPGISLLLEARPKTVEPRRTNHWQGCGHARRPRIPRPADEPSPRSCWIAPVASLRRHVRTTPVPFQKGCGSVFLNSESPESDPIALWGTPYEVAVER